ncbi:uncharacterized protein YbjT (DUF2867 family) [Novosphingobium chloroacetimidivorans]|uniref:Uncharacterized protein YbjT (DUF2867 family) n=2 Tax=Novosphingobium chloroacetimidivorans TaxID=1428314 RepID=A0A7W7KA33_9SPHN|nr:uncharacterized protein YbjT (DUF2867 family) [Novosphingobium chloroacetimidivorans]
MVRDPASAAAKALAASGVAVVPGDLGDAAALRSAMIGADGVFSMQPNSGDPTSGITDAEEVRIGRLVADSAVEAGVTHLVYSSASVISRGPTGIANLDCKLEIEDHVRSLAIPTTIVRPATFMELLAQPAFWSDADELVFFTSPDQPVELIAAQDIGTIVAAVLADRDRFAGLSIDIAGEELAGADIGSAISRALGRPISYRRFPDALLKQQPALDRTVRMFASGVAAGNADIAALSREFGPLTGLDAWLAGSGHALIRSAARGTKT